MTLWFCALSWVWTRGQGVLLGLYILFLHISQPILPHCLEMPKIRWGCSGMLLSSCSLSLGPACLNSWFLKWHHFQQPWPKRVSCCWQEHVVRDWVLGSFSTGNFHLSLRYLWIFLKLICITTSAYVKETPKTWLPKAIAASQLWHFKSPQIWQTLATSCIPGQHISKSELSCKAGGMWGWGGQPCTRSLPSKHWISWNWLLSGSQWIQFAALGEKGKKVSVPW